MYVGSHDIDDVLTFTANTHTTAGAESDADSPPTYRVYEDETGTAILTGSMALLDSSNTDGQYSEQITLSAANGFELNKCYTVRIRATVGGVSGATHRFFQIGARVNIKYIDDQPANATTDPLPAQLADVAHGGAAATLQLATSTLGAATAASLAVSGTLSAGTFSATTNSLPWNAAWDAEVQSEAADAIVAASLPTAAQVVSALGTGSTLTALATQASVNTVSTRVLLALPAAAPAGSGGLMILGTNTAAVAFTAGMTIGNSTGHALYLNSSGGDPGYGLYVESVGGGIGVVAADVAMSLESVASHALMLDGGTGGDDLYLVGSDAPTLVAAFGTGATLTALATQASVNTIDDFLDTEVAAIKAKTDQLSFTGGGNVQADVQEIDANVIHPIALAAILSYYATNGYLPNVAGVNGVTFPSTVPSAAQVNAEVVDALSTDTYAQPTGVPVPTDSLANKLGRLHQALIGELTVTSTALTFYTHGGSALWKKTVADDGTTYSETDAAAP
jgi:hypothetical protein